MQRAVKGLTYQYARYAGQIETLHVEKRRLQHVIDQAKALISKHISALAENEETIKVIASKMELLNRSAVTAFDQDISTTAPRKTWPKSHLSSWGAMTRAILQKLAFAKGTPLTTGDIAIAVDVELNLHLDDAGIADLKQKVRHRLKALRNRGVVIRVRSATKFAEHSTWVIADFAG